MIYLQPQRVAVITWSSVTWEDYGAASIAAGDTEYYRLPIQSNTSITSGSLIPIWFGRSPGSVSALNAGIVISSDYLIEIDGVDVFLQVAIVNGGSASQTVGDGLDFTAVLFEPITTVAASAFEADY